MSEFFKSPRPFAIVFGSQFQTYRSILIPIVFFFRSFIWRAFDLGPLSASRTIWKLNTCVARVEAPSYRKTPAHVVSFPANLIAIENQQIRFCFIIIFSLYWFLIPWKCMKNVENYCSIWYKKSWKVWENWNYENFHLIARLLTIDFQFCPNDIDELLQCFQLSIVLRKSYFLRLDTQSSHVCLFFSLLPLFERFAAHARYRNGSRLVHRAHTITHIHTHRYGEYICVFSIYNYMGIYVGIPV